MRNPDLCIVFNNGEVSFILLGLYYETRWGVLTWAHCKYCDYVKSVLDMADKPEELNFEIRSINIYELTS